MLALRLHMDFTPETHGEAASVLRSLVGPVRAESGCRATRLMTDSGGGHRLTWVEEWSGVEDFERHLRGVAFRKILAVIELAAEPPIVEAGTIGPYSDPLEQALVLTAIVITFGITALLLALAYRSWTERGSDDVEDDTEDRRIARAVLRR